MAQCFIVQLTREINYSLLEQIGHLSSNADVTCKVPVPLVLLGSHSPIAQHSQP